MWAFAVVCMPCLGRADGKAVGPIVRVRGETHVTVHWQREAAVDPDAPAILRLEGQAVDDAERPLPNAEVTVTLGSAEGNVLVDMSHATTCADPPTQLHRMGDGELVVRADSDGRFCLRTPLAVRRYRLHVEAAWEKERYDPVPLEQELDFGKPPLSLWLEGSDGKPDLTQESWVLAARVGYEDGGRLVYAAGLKIDWIDEKGITIASSSSDRDGHVRFTIASSLLGDPGLARHRLKCEGSSTLSGAELSFSLEKRARLELVLESAPNEARAGVELPYTFRVRIVRSGADAARQLFAAQALVQASFVGAASGLVGAAESDARGAVLVPVLLAAGGQSGTLEFRATARVPFLLPSEPLRLPVEVSEPRSWRSSWLLGGFLVLVVWLALGRAPQRRAPTPSRSPAAAARVAEPPRAEVLVHEERSAPRWNGTLLDAHERTPIGAAHVRLMRPGFAGLELLAECSSAADGTFVLDGSAKRPGDRLVVEAPLHRPLDVAAPAFGAMSITAISRRRGVLHDFARWAQSRPWSAALRRRATPLDAVTREDAAWAAQVDRVVFGPEPVDAAREASAPVPEPTTHTE